MYPSSLHHNLCISFCTVYLLCTCIYFQCVCIIFFHYNLCINLYSTCALSCIFCMYYLSTTKNEGLGTRLGNEASIISPPQSVQYISTVLYTISSVYLITSLSIPLISLSQRVQTDSFKCSPTDKNHSSDKVKSILSLARIFSTIY